MAVVKKTKASDLQALCKKLITLLKKHYKPHGSRKDRPVLESMLYAVCLENATHAQADAAYERLHSTFHDLNEIRVSTFLELTPVFEDMSDPEARAARVRSILQYVFEINFDFDFESLKKKTIDLAEKQLQKIRFLTPFIELHTLQIALGTHMIPLDDRMRDACVWLGLAVPGASITEAADGLKAAILKSDTPVFCHYLRDFATDPRLQSQFNPTKHKALPDGHDLDNMLERADELIINAEKAAKSKSKPKKPAASKASSKSSGHKVGTKRVAVKNLSKAGPAKKKKPR